MMNSRQLPLLFLGLFAWLIIGAGFCSMTLNSSPTSEQDEILTETAEAANTTSANVDDRRINYVRDTYQNEPAIIGFDEGKMVLGDKENQMIQDMAYYAKHNPNSSIEVSGHTDSYGRYEYNMKLSEERAQRAAELIISAGAPGDQVHSIGYGKDRPMYRNDTKENRLKNRRVEIVLR